MRSFSEELRFIPAFLLLLVIYHVTGCPIKLLTGISCPGCGMTRAWIQLLQLHPAAAFACHPLFPVPVIFVIFYVLKKYGIQKPYRIVNTILAVLLIVVYVVRLLDPTDTIVVFEPQNGLIWRVVSAILPG